MADEVAATKSIHEYMNSLSCPLCGFQFKSTRRTAAQEGIIVRHITECSTKIHHPEDEGKQVIATTRTKDANVAKDSRGRDSYTNNDATEHDSRSLEGTSGSEITGNETKSASGRLPPLAASSLSSEKYDSGIESVSPLSMGSTPSRTHSSFPSSKSPLPPNQTKLPHELYVNKEEKHAQDSSSLQQSLHEQVEEIELPAGNNKSVLSNDKHVQKVNRTGDKEIQRNDETKSEKSRHIISDYELKQLNNEGCDQLPPTKKRRQEQSVTVCPICNKLFNRAINSMADINKHVMMCSDAQTIGNTPSIVRSTSTYSSSKAKASSMEPAKSQSIKRTIKEKSKEKGKTCSAIQCKQSNYKKLSNEEIEKQRIKSLHCLMQGPAKRALDQIVLHYLSSDLK